MSICIACGETLGEVIVRTSKPKCYVFKSDDPDDWRNGMHFHTREGVIVESNTLVTIFPAGLESQKEWEEKGWKVPQREPKENS